MTQIEYIGRGLMFDIINIIVEEEGLLFTLKKKVPHFFQELNALTRVCHSLH